MIWAALLKLAKILLGRVTGPLNNKITLCRHVDISVSEREVMIQPVSSLQAPLVSMWMGPSSYLPMAATTSLIYTHCDARMEEGTLDLPWPNHCLARSLQPTQPHWEFGMLRRFLKVTQLSVHGIHDHLLMECLSREFIWPEDWPQMIS